MFNSYNVEIIHTEKNDVSEQEDLATDLISIIASFSGRLYGKRSGERRRIENSYIILFFTYNKARNKARKYNL